MKLQEAATLAVDHGAGGDHLGVKQGAAGNQPQKKAQVTIGAVHHRCDAKAVIGHRLFYPSAFESGRRHGRCVSLPGIEWNGLAKDNGPLGVCASIGAVVERDPGRHYHRIRHIRGRYSGAEPEFAGAPLRMRGLVAMPSFDAVSELDMHEVSNAVDQANREVATRFDFKGTDSKFEREKAVLTLRSESEFQLGQMLDILRSKLNRRGIDIACMKIEKPEMTGTRAHQSVVLRQGLETDLAKKMVKMIKDAKLKVQAQIQGEKIRVTGKKRDDLQQVIAVLKAADIDMPLQFTNFRD
jgi:uncharacterized protein YajQ (UPF0234 family)